MDPKTYLIVGRRGTGKSSLAHYFTFQDQIPNARCIDVDEPDIYKHVVTRIAATAAATPEVAIPRIVRVWEYVIWALIFRELVDEDPAIAAACVVRDRESAVNIVLRILKHLLSKYLNDERGELADDMESYLSSELIRKAQRAAVKICQHRPLIVAIDSLEHYAITDEATMRAAAALVECASKFNRDYSRQGIHVKVFLTAEVYPQLAETVISDPLKYIRNPLFLHSNQDYSPLKFRTMVAELGIVGRVRKVDDRTKLVEADFEYAVNQPLSLQVDDDCVVHPMFYERFRINSGDGFTVFPFPDKPEFAGMQN